MKFIPSYTHLFKSGQLQKKINKLYEHLAQCDICPRRCGVNRLENQKGYCGTGINAIIGSYGPHFGEEAPLVGKYGSGTIFISSCNLKCVFCQNFELSHLKQGEEVNCETFAEIMMELQNMNCHNINVVTPTHIVPQLLSSLFIAIEMGLYLPLVYNSGGYENIQVLKILDGIVDIYMPDIKFLDRNASKEFLVASDYPEIVKGAIKEMHRQVGDLIINKDRIAVKGLLIRHLIMPGMIEDTKKIIDFVANEVSPNSYINIMRQYRPSGLAYKFPQINRCITNTEYKEAVEYAKAKGLRLA
jgi:putative pyruvate formate lyase activating enzyme